MNLDVAQKWAVLESFWGTYVLLTKAELTEGPTLSRRAEIANSDGNIDVFVSVHHNGWTDPNLQRTETYYRDDLPYASIITWSELLADEALEEIADKFGYETSGPLTDAKAVLGYLRMPGTLTEASYITNPVEAALLLEDQHRQDEAAALYNAFGDYLGGTAPGGFACTDWYEEDRYGLEWDPVAGADGYVLSCYYTCNDRLRAQWDVMWSSCDVGYSELSPWTSYYFVVKAYVERPEGRFFGGDSRQLYLIDECIPMGVSRSIWDFSAAGGEHQISLTWKASDFDEGEGFYVYRSTNGGQCYDCDPSLGYVPFDPMQENYSFVDTSTAYNTAYFYKILDTEGDDWWGPAFASPTGGVVNPPVPSPAPDLAVCRVGDGHVHLCLEEGSQYTAQYRVSWKEEGGSWAEILHQGETCLEKPELENGTVYVFKAVGENVSGQTAASEEIRAVPMPPPTDFGGEPGDECIRLWWDGVASASGYKVYYSTDPLNLWAWSKDVGDTTRTTLMDLENGILYYTRVVAYDQFGNETEPSNSYASTPRSYLAVPETEVALPGMFALGPNYPNPFNPSTVISYDLPSPSDHVRLAIYDVRGARVRTLVDGPQAAGTRLIPWDGTDGEGRLVPPGVYFYRLEADGSSETRKMVLVK